MGKWKEALRLLGLAESLDPRSDVPLFQTAITHHMMRNYDKAKTYYERAGGWFLRLASLHFEQTGDGSKLKSYLKNTGVYIGNMKASNNNYSIFQFEFLNGNNETALDILNQLSDSIFFSQESIIPVSLCRAWTYDAMGKTIESHKAFTLDTFK